MTLDEFRDATAPLYRQFGWKQDGADRAAHEYDRYKVLQTFGLATMHRAVAALLATETRMPTIASIRQACLDAIRRARPPKPSTADDGWPDTNTCPCGCGGRRWAREMTSGWTRDAIHCRRRRTGAPPTDPPVRIDARDVAVYARGSA